MKKNEEMILLMLEEAKKGYDLYKDDFDILENGFLNILPPDVVADLQKKRKSSITPKIIKSKIRRIVIGVLKTYFENDEFAKLKPLFADENKQTQKIQEALNHWLDRRINLYTRLKPVIYDACIYGLCCMRVYWKNGLRLSRVKIKDIYIDPNAESIFDIQYMVNRVYTTIGKLKKDFGNKKYFKNYAGDYGDDTKVSTEFIGDATRVLIYELYRVENGVWKVSTILPDYRFLRTDEELKDGLPFVFGTIDPQFSKLSDKNVVEAYGGSQVEPLIPLQDEYTIIRNQQIDAINEQLNLRLITTKMAGLNAKDVASNKRVITATDISQVRPLEQPNINQSTFATERLDMEMQEVSGITKYSQGMHSKGLNQTATGISILTQESNEVIADIIRSLNESFFEPLIGRITRLIYKYDENPLLYGVDRKQDLRFKVAINAGVGATNKEILLNNITTAEQTTMQIIKISMEMQDIDRANKYLKILDELYAKKLSTIGFKNLIPKKEEIEEENGRELELQRDIVGSQELGGEQGLEAIYGGDAGSLQQSLYGSNEL